MHSRASIEAVERKLESTFCEIRPEISALGGPKINILGLRRFIMAPPRAGECGTGSYLGGDRHGWGLIGTRYLWHNRNKLSK